eukprot:gnl/Carplike_NY0171/1664_a2250_1239.p1 GENE.gnl/Carplike_NY0171/1664_a2250_1239~~gnl/Carplike_NY0171/1664_a2250_1239.p1  ORF type:complete len:277 (-),score=38.99 gnl/Carplike_NY0171/1664_a2250_1239:55-825(-)
MSEENSVKYRFCSTNLIGSQLWQLIIVDMFVQMFISLGLPLLLVATGCLPKYPFRVSVLAVQIIYTYVLSSLGVVFSPGISIEIVLVNFVVFYIKKIEIMHFCRREDKPWGASSMNRFFSVLFSVVFLIMLIPMAYSLSVSTTCGPHAGVGYTQTLYDYMDIVSVGIPTKQLQDDGTIAETTLSLNGLFHFIVSPIILGIISLVFGVLFFIFKGFTSAYSLAIQDILAESDKLKQERKEFVQREKMLRRASQMVPK